MMEVLSKEASVVHRLVIGDGKHLVGSGWDPSSLASLTKCTSYIGMDVCH